VNLDSQQENCHTEHSQNGSKGLVNIGLDERITSGN
jgi:hypothetical protein